MCQLNSYSTNKQTGFPSSWFRPVLANITSEHPVKQVTWQQTIKTKICLWSYEKHEWQPALRPCIADRHFFKCLSHLNVCHTHNLHTQSLPVQPGYRPVRKYFTILPLLNLTPWLLCTLCEAFWHTCRANLYPERAVRGVCTVVTSATTQQTHNLPRFPVIIFCNPWKKIIY